MRTATAPIMRTIDRPDAKTALYVWLSPAFPVGGFAFSHALEWAVEAGDVRNSVTLESWLRDLIRYGAPRADALLLGAVWRSPEEAPRLNELALALAGTAERQLETGAQGSAFLKAVDAAWPEPKLTAHAAHFEGGELAYPIAVGLAATCHTISLEDTLRAFLVATIGNLVSAVLRLGPIGQSDAQAIIARLMPSILDLACWAESAALDEIGTAAWRSDLAAMRHETQYSRLFRS